MPLRVSRVVGSPLVGRAGRLEQMFTPAKGDILISRRSVAPRVLHTGHAARSRPLPSAPVRSRPLPSAPLHISHTSHARAPSPSRLFSRLASLARRSPRRVPSRRRRVSRRGPRRGIVRDSRRVGPGPLSPYSMYPHVCCLRLLASQSHESVVCLVSRSCLASRANVSTVKKASLSIVE